MKKHLGYLAFICIVNMNLAHADSLTITIDNIQPNKGSLHIGLFTETDTFPVVTADLNKIIVQPKEAVITQTFENLEAGNRYAVAVFQDSNNSQTLEKNIFGAPKEPYGFSQLMPKFRAPTFDESAITLTAPETNTRITLR